MTEAELLAAYGVRTPPAAAALEAEKLPPTDRAALAAGAFLGHVRRLAGLDACWLWTGTRTRAGYGVLWVDGQRYNARRVAYEHFVGPVPAGMVLRGACDRRACVRPDHLVVATPAENVAAMAKRRWVSAPTRAAREVDYQTRRRAAIAAARAAGF